MTKHTDQNGGTQTLEMYGCTVALSQRAGFEIEVTFAGGTWPNGEEARTFPNLAAALAAVAEIAANLEAEDGPDWGGEPDATATAITAEELNVERAAEVLDQVLRARFGTGINDEQRAALADPDDGAGMLDDLEARCDVGVAPVRAALWSQEEIVPSVRDYFCQWLGTDLSGSGEADGGDNPAYAAASIPILSPCGSNCANAIDHARGLIAELREAVGVDDRLEAGVRAAARRAVEVFVCG